MKKFDIVVVGGGHAGVEATYIASQFNIKIALVTLPSVRIGSAPCNPSIGGVGKGQVVREIDALGGAMGILADLSGIQYRTLNESKGFAVQSTRVQIDKDLYADEAEKLITSLPNVTIIRDKLISVITSADGYVLEMTNDKIFTQKIIMTVGTFLDGKLHTGDNITIGGRRSIESSPSLDSIFGNVKTRPSRFKTGTPARILKTSVDFSKMDEQPSDGSTRNFHFKHLPFNRKVQQVSCYLTRTNPETMSIIRLNKEKSPMYNGQIKAVGARYCPSIEDKAYRYPDKDNHHIFVEPEGLNHDCVYPSGLSSSLPANVQEDFFKTINGFENCKIKHYGYAVEYDVVDTTDLGQTLEHKNLKGLYFAGQVNGTSGYEEAAGQGLIAGSNAALSLIGKEPLILSRHDSYIGVMIEDLCTNTRDEPYRLFTARSENRVYIREDNTLIRMAKYRRQLGLQSEFDDAILEYVQLYNSLSIICDKTMLTEDSSFLASFSGELPEQKLVRRMSITELLKQAWLNPIDTLASVLEHFDLSFSLDLIRCVAIEKKYDGYIKRFEEQFEKVKKMELTKINWEEVCESKNISFECKARISKVRPETFGQLKQIEGIRPATLATVAAKAL